MLSNLNPDTDSLPDIHAFVGSCGWARGQLLQEEANGLWWLVAASPECINDLLRSKILSSDWAQRKAYIEEICHNACRHPWCKASLCLIIIL